MTVSIVIPCFNRWELTEKAIAAVWANTQPGTYILVIVDNGSDDATATFDGADVVLHNPGNLGFAVGCNLGAAAEPEPEVLVFLNNDTLVHPGWLPPLVDALQRPGIGLAGPKLVYPDGNIQHAGIEFKKTNEGVTAFEIRREQPAGITAGVTGACLAIRRDCFNALGGFDDGYWNGYEDVDLNLKANANGWSSWYARDSVVTHLVAASGPERWSAVSQNVQRLQDNWGEYFDTDNRNTAIIIPAMRAHLMGPLLENIEATTPEPHRVLVVSSDPAIDQICQRAGVECLPDDGRGTTWGQRLNHAFDHLQWGVQYLFLGADDVVFHQGWLSAAHAVMNDADQVVSVNDTLTDEGTLALVSRRYVELYSGVCDEPNTVIHPGYRHCYSERELYDTARARGRFAYAAESVVEHNHWLAGKSELDSIYQDGENAKRNDQLIFETRRQAWWEPQ